MKLIQDEAVGFVTQFGKPISGGSIAVHSATADHFRQSILQSITVRAINLSILLPACQEGDCQFSTILFIFGSYNFSFFLTSVVSAKKKISPFPHAQHK